jgi:hypothetical protein
MLKYALMVALVSVVSGCVTSDPGTLYGQSASRSAQAQRTAQTTVRTVRTAQTPKPAMILGAAY